MIAAAITNPVGAAIAAGLIFAIVAVAGAVAVLDRLLPDDELPTEERP